MEYLTIFKNTLSQLIVKIITSTTGFVIALIIARHLGATLFGDYTKIITVVTLFYLIVDFGLNAVFLQKDKENKHFKDLLYFRIFASLFLIIFLTLILYILPYNKELNLGFSPQVKLSIFLYSFTIIFYAILICANAVFQKKLRYEQGLLPNAVGSIITFLLILVLVYSSFGLISIIIVLAIGAAVKSGLSLLIIREKIFPVSLDFVFIKNLVRESLPLGLMLIFNLVYFRADLLLLSFLSPTRDVGIYGLSYNFFDFLIALPLFLSNSIYPILIRSQKKLSKFFSLAKKYFFIFVGISFVVMFLFWFASSFFYLIKDDFIKSVLPFRILLLSLPFFFATSLLQWTLITLQQQKYLLYVYLYVGVLNVLLNVIFIPMFSYIASAIITGLCEAIVFALLVKKMLSIREIYVD